LPFFKRAERWTGDETEIHGTEGNLTTSPMTERPQACHAIIEAAQQLGLEYRPDVNNLPRGAGDSIGWCQQTRGGRRRASTAVTYLRPAKKRANLQILTNALVHRVVFDGKRAVAVEFSRQSGVERVAAAREVIVSAGAVGSPHLLQLSGIGGPEVLQKAGIAVRNALPGVGRNFQDHYIARMSCYVRDLETLNERARGLGFANEIMRYLLQGKGMITFGASLCAASVKVLPESATPDVQCVFAPASYKPGLIRRLDDRPGITGGPWQMRPLSRGHVLVRTPDPHDQPAINPRYLAEDTDQRAIVGGLKFLRRLFAAPALAKHIIGENLPGPGVQSDDELLDYARSNGSTVYHASCSCMMGNHGMAVVDDQLRVHGLEALRVVDASVMPAVSSTNTNAPTIMIAEKGAAMIKAGERAKLAA
jgi:choline dehydrogenase